MPSLAHACGRPWREHTSAMLKMSDVWIILNYLLSCTVSSEIWRSIGPIFAVNRECLSLTALICGESLNSGLQMWPQQARNVRLSYGVKCIPICWTVRRDSRVWQTDRQMDRRTNGRTDRHSDSKFIYLFIYLKSATEGPEGHLYCRKNTETHKMTVQKKGKKKKEQTKKTNKQTI